MIQITKEQAQAIVSQPETPLVNPLTGEVFVLVRMDVYERMKQIVDGPNRRGWDDPELDVYEQYRKKA